MAGKSLADAAAQEAFEEAGVRGRIDPEPLGWFEHDKQHAVYGSIRVRIAVHPLAVERQQTRWPESGERKRRWFSLKRAAAEVESGDLAKLILQLRSVRVRSRR